MTQLSDLTFTLAQLNPKVGDLEGNALKIIDTLKSSYDCNIIIFPELILSGYSPEDLVLRSSFVADIEDQIDLICEETLDFKGLALISTPWTLEGVLYNAVLVISEGQIKSVIPKHHLPNYGVFDEKRIFDTGPMPEPFEFNSVKLGICTCEDIWRDDVTMHLKDQGAEIIISLNGSPYDVTKCDTRQEVVKKRCLETNLPHIYVNQVGGQDEVVYDGGSFVMAAKGSILHQCAFFEEDISSFSFKNAKPFHHVATNQYDHIYQALCLGVKDYINKNGFKGILMGLSGGIDSALSAVIACDAIGAENVYCVMMPSPYTAQISLDDASELATNLGCSYDIIEIEPSMTAVSKMIGEAATKGLAAENLQSRLRGLTLMALSNANGQMVLSTGNKSEMAVGYATLYGDMCGGFNALKDIYKTDVFALSRHVNEISGTARIPERIITRPPSAELRPDQKDEDSLPPYDDLDAILKAIIEDRAPLEDIVAQGYDAEIVVKVQRLLSLAEYKRRQAPPGVKITPKAFGRDRRYPITNGYREDA
jgi:NAD+ synthase